MVRFDVVMNIIVMVELLIVIFLAYRVLFKYRYKSYILFFISLILLALCTFFNMLYRLGKVIIVGFLGHNLNLTDMLFTEFLLLSLLAWSLSIHYMDNENLTSTSVGVIAIIAMAAIGEIFEQHKFEMTINIMVEIAGLVLFAYIIVEHFVRSMWGLRIKELRRVLLMYVCGFVFLIVMGMLSLGSQLVGPPIEDMLADAWLLGLSTCIFFSGVMLVKYPSLLLINISRPRKLIIATETGLPVLDLNFVVEKDKGINPAFISSALTGVSSIIKEITGKELPLKSISIGEYTIMISMRGNVVGYIFVDKPSMLVREVLDKVVERVEKKFGDLFEDDVVVVDERRRGEIIEEIAELFPFIVVRHRG